MPCNQAKGFRAATCRYCNQDFAKILPSPTKAALQTFLPPRRHTKAAHQDDPAKDIPSLGRWVALDLISVGVRSRRVRCTYLRSACSRQRSPTRAAAALGNVLVPELSTVHNNVKWHHGTSERVGKEAELAMFYTPQARRAEHL